MTEKEQIKADLAFRRANTKQRIRTIKHPIVIKRETGERFRPAKCTQVDDGRVIVSRYLVRV